MKSHLGKYRLISELGAGGMGRVYKAYEPALDRYVAIKQLSDTHLHDAVLVERFLREARAMAALNDPHILQVFAIEPDEEPPFFVMEFVDGESLSSLLQRVGRLPAGDALKILYGAALGLRVAHENELIHRDIKPANLMLTRRGQVKIADFGIVMDFRRQDSKLTGTGEFVGTPGYLPPEIWLGQPGDARTDIFALGVALYEMLAGHTPFNTESPYKLMEDVVNRDAPDVRTLNDAVEPDVAALLHRMLARAPEDRFPDARSLIAALEQHPEIRQGGALRTAIAGPSGRAAAEIDRSGSFTPGAGHAATDAFRTSVGLRPPVAATPASVPRPATGPLIGAAEAVAERSQEDAAIAVERQRAEAATMISQRPRQRPRRWPLWLLALAGLAGTGWAAVHWNLAGLASGPGRDRVVAWWPQLVQGGQALSRGLAGWLAPILDRLGLPVAPRLAANLLLAAIALTLAHSLWQALRRAASRRRQRRAGLSGH